MPVSAKHLQEELRYTEQEFKKQKDPHAKLLLVHEELRMLSELQEEKKRGCGGICVLDFVRQVRFLCKWVIADADTL